MPNFLIKCNYEKLFTADIDVEVPNDEDELSEFMAEFEEENDVNWTEAKMAFEYSGYQV
jgi:hypothetical protein